MSKEYRFLLVGVIISWSLGYIGADRMYKGETGLAILKLLTIGGFGIWWLIDAMLWTRELGQSKD